MSSTTSVLSHWNTLLPGFQASPQVFYAEVAKAIERRKVPNASMRRLLLREGNILSANREYLQVGCKDFYFAVCGAPFGTGFFVSWWLIEPPLGCFAEMMLAIPVIGPICQLMLTPLTYYKVDTAMMFQTVIHSAVLEVIDSITSTQGVKGLTEAERKPIMREFFQF